jgi:hypothetical protein
MDWRAAYPSGAWRLLYRLLRALLFLAGAMNLLWMAVLNMPRRERAVRFRWILV